MGSRKASLSALPQSPTHTPSTLLLSVLNRKKGNDQELIQLPITFRPRHQREGRKAAQSKHYKQKAKRTVFSPKISQTAIQNKKFTRKYMQNHTMTEIVNHSRSTAVEWSVTYYCVLGWWCWGGGEGELRSIFCGHNPRH